jgi:hypothetical protein
MEEETIQWPQENRIKRQTIIYKILHRKHFMNKIMHTAACI